LQFVNAEHSFVLFEGLGQHVKLRALDVVLHVFILVALSVDVIRHVLDLALALLDSRVQLHCVFGSVLQSLLQVRDLSRQLSLRGPVLGILLLHLWQVLQLNGLPLEYRSLHILDGFFLLFAKLVVT